MRKAISAAALIMVPLLVVLSGTGLVRWDITAAVSAVLCCVPFFLSFEGRAPSAAELVLVACMTAFSAAGRVVFAPFPFFKPVTAVVVLCGMYLGPGAGFMTGALSAVISNIYFGQGAWTPFQMLCWGGLGLLAGVLNLRKLLEKRGGLAVFGVLSGVLYSAVMDVWTTLSMDGSFSVERWLAAVIAALPVTAVYAASNVLFLLLLKKPVGRQLERLKVKYGVFLPKEQSE